MEELAHALGSNAKLYAGFSGYGLAGDASYLTASSEDGSGALRAMRNALQDIGFSNASVVIYTKAHATFMPSVMSRKMNATDRLFRDYPWFFQNA